LNWWGEERLPTIVCTGARQNTAWVRRGSKRRPRAYRWKRNRLCKRRETNEKKDKKTSGESKGGLDGGEEEVPYFYVGKGQ